MSAQKKKIPKQENNDIDAFEEWEDVPLSDANKQDDSITDDVDPKDLPQQEEHFEESLTDDFTEEMIDEEAPVSKKDTHMPAEVLEMSSDISVQLVAVIGKTTISVKDLMNYQMGQVIDLRRLPGETVDLVASGKLFAKGELVDVDGQLGVRIIKILK